MKIHTLKVDRMQEPIGIDPKAPLFSFCSEMEGVFAVSLFPYGAVVPEQECVVTTQNCGGFYFPKPLREGTLYRWQVSDGKIAVGARFETGITFRFPFISPAVATSTVPVFKRAFEASAAVVRARLYLTANCFYRGVLNDERVGRHYLTAGMGAESDSFLYRTYDVTDLLWRGAENSLHIYLSDSDRACMAAGLVMTLSDGRQKTISTDESWRVLESGCMMDPNRNSEQQRDSVALGRCIRTVRVGKAFGSCSAQRKPPMLARAVLSPTVVYSPAGERLLDFGNCIFGIVRFRAQLPEGQRVVLRFRERLQTETLGYNEFCFVSNGAKRLYEPMFSCFRFRYVSVEGMTIDDPSIFEAVVIA